MTGWISLHHSITFSFESSSERSLLFIFLAYLVPHSLGISKDIVAFLSHPPLISMYIDILPAYISVYHLCVNSARRGEKRVLDTLGLNEVKDVSCHAIGARNQTQVLW